MGINYYLSREFKNQISILSTNKVSKSFHARFSAKYRKYQYTILNKRVPSPLYRNNSWRIPLPLDIKLMQKASKLLIGKHNFSAFRSSECQSKSPIKTIDEIKIKKNEELIEITIKAKSFLMNQVRIITGTLIEIGLKRKTDRDILLALKDFDKKHTGPTAPPRGLILTEVTY